MRLGSSSTDVHYTSSALYFSGDFTKLKSMNTMLSNSSEIFVANVRARMQEIGINQKELAKRLSVTDSAVSQVLKGLMTPGLDVVDKYADALSCEPFELLQQKKFARAS